MSSATSWAGPPARTCQIVVVRNGESSARNGWCCSLSRCRARTKRSLKVDLNERQHHPDLEQRGHPAAKQIWRPAGAATVSPRQPRQCHSDSSANSMVGCSSTIFYLNSPASRAGIKTGDILVGLHLWEMLTLNNVVFVLNHPDRQSFSPVPVLHPAKRADPSRG